MYWVDPTPIESNRNSTVREAMVKLILQANFSQSQSSPSSLTVYSGNGGSSGGMGTGLGGGSPLGLGREGEWEPDVDRMKMDAEVDGDGGDGDEAASSSQDSIVKQSRRQQEKSDPSTCMFWCAVALGGLTAGRPVKTVRYCNLVG